MDSFEVNKVLGAVFGTLLLALGSGFVAELIYHPKPAGKAGYELPEPEPAPAGGAAAAPKAEPIAVRLASASAEKGQGGTKACQACHSFEKGGPNKVGPDLYDVVERQKAGHGGFDYSAALKDKGGTWTYEDLDHFLESPKGFVKGTKMAFAGIGNPAERANVIAYLRSLSESPKPLPAAEKKAEDKPAEKAAETKPAETKPAETKPAASKGSEGKDSPAKPADPKAPDAVPAQPKPPEAVNTRNDPGPTQSPQAQPDPGKPAEAAPATPPAAPAQQPAPGAEKPSEQ